MFEALADKLLQDLTNAGYLLLFNEDYSITEKGLTRIDELLAERYDYLYANKIMPIETRINLIDKLKKDLNRTSNNSVEQLLIMETEISTVRKTIAHNIKKDMLQ